MEIILFRHGLTEGNIHRRYNGHTDEQLCEKGILQAQNAGILDNMKYAYISPMQRAIQTARICFPYAQMHIIEELREMDFGDFEGRTADEMIYDTAYRKWVNSNCEGQCPNGEDIFSFQQRVQNAFKYIIFDALGRHLNKFAIVAHGGTIMAIMSKFAHPKRAYYDWHVSNCCGYEIYIDEDEWKDVSRFTKYKYLDRLKKR